MGESRMSKREREVRRRSREVSRQQGAVKSRALYPWLFPAALFAIYVLFLIYRHDRVPAGLNNDAAEEALRGIYLVAGRHFEVMTLMLGHSAETLYLYLMGGMAQLLGPTTISIQLTSWIFALA